MGKTTFTGPIRAGSILQTSGTTVGKDVRNVGHVVMAQHYTFTQAGSTTALATTIVLPANSHVLEAQMTTLAAWTGASATVSIGTTATSNELVSAGSVAAVGVNVFSPGTDATRTAKWDDVGTSDVRIYVLSANTGTGSGTLVIRYIQAQDTL